MKQTNKIRELFDELIPLFFEKINVAVRNFNHEGIKCTKNQKKSMLILSRHRSITASELGKKLEMERGSLTSLVDSLEKLNLIKRESYPADRRKILLYLTPQGEAYIAALTEAFQEHMEQLLKNKSNEEIANFSANLEEVVIFIKNL